MKAAAVLNAAPSKARMLRVCEPAAASAAIVTAERSTATKPVFASTGWPPTRKLSPPLSSVSSSEVSASPSASSNPRMSDRLIVSPTFSLTSLTVISGARLGCVVVRSKLTGALNASPSLTATVRDCTVAAVSADKVTASRSDVTNPSPPASTGASFTRQLAPPTVSIKRTAATSSPSRSETERIALSGVAAPMLRLTSSIVATGARLG